MENNFYFETLNGIQGEMTEDSIVKRLQEINTVLNDLAGSPAWSVLLRDSREMIRKLDDSWQDFPHDSSQLREARILKMATKHISELPYKYSQEMEMLQEELHKRQKPEEYIQKDADNEV